MNANRGLSSIFTNYSHVTDLACPCEELQEQGECLHSHGLGTTRTGSRTATDPGHPRRLNILATPPHPLSDLRTIQPHIIREPDLDQSESWLLTINFGNNQWIVIIVKYQTKITSTHLTIVNLSKKWRIWMIKQDLLHLNSFPNYPFLPKPTGKLTINTIYLSEKW